MGVDPTATSTSIKQTNTNDADPPHKKYQEIIDKIAFVEETEIIPPGQLTQDIERDMLSLMRQLSPMGRRQDDNISSFTPDGVLRQSRTLQPLPKKDNTLHNGTSHYARQRRQDATIVERLLDRLLLEYQYSNDDTTDDIITEKRENDGDANIQHRRSSNQSNINSARTYNLAIKAWANANVRGSAEKAERVLKRLKIASSSNGKMGNSSIGSRSRNLPTKPLGPDIYSFAYCYAAWYKESIFASKQIDSMKASTIALRKAESVLQSMKQLLMRQRGEDDKEFNNRQWNMVEDVNSLLTMWSTTDPSLPEMQETFVKFIEVESRDLADIWLNARSFNLVINGESIDFRKMIGLMMESGDNLQYPRTYYPRTYLLPAWAKSGRSESLTRSEALLQIMEMSDKVSPDLLSYSGVISCIANSNNRATDVAKAEKILDLLTSGKSDVQPDNGERCPRITVYCPHT